MRGRSLLSTRGAHLRQLGIDQSLCFFLIHFGHLRMTLLQPFPETPRRFGTFAACWISLHDIEDRTRFFHRSENSASDAPVEVRRRESETRILFAHSDASTGARQDVGEDWEN